MKTAEQVLNEWCSDEIEFSFGVNTPSSGKHTRESLHDTGLGMRGGSFFSEDFKWVYTCFEKVRGWDTETTDKWIDDFFKAENLARFCSPMEVKIALRDMCRDLQYPGWRAKMERMDLIFYPNPLLTAKNATIPTYTPEIAEKVKLMLPIMQTKDGVGLAAPQVGWNVRLFVGYVNKVHEPSSLRVYYNPEITTSGEKVFGEEGCLSFPRLRAQIARYTEVEIKAMTPDGPIVERIEDPFYARMIQHEMDHLDGLLFIERMTPADQQKNKNLLKVFESLHRESRSPDSISSR